MYPITTEQAWANIDRDLRGYFDFSEDDLAANQHGEVTPHQIQCLKDRINRLKRKNAVELLLTSLFGGFYLLFIPYGWLVVLPSLVMISAIVMNRRKIHSNEQDLAQPTVATVSGPATRQIVLFASDRRYPYENKALIIQGVVFKITRERHVTLVLCIHGLLPTRLQIYPLD